MEEETDFIEIHFPSRYISWILKDWIPLLFHIQVRIQIQNILKFILKMFQCNQIDLQTTKKFFSSHVLNGRMLKETNQPRPIVNKNIFLFLHLDLMRR